MVPEVDKHTDRRTTPEKVAAEALVEQPTNCHLILPTMTHSLQLISYRILQITAEETVVMGDSVIQQQHQVTLYLIRWLLFGMVAVLVVVVQVRAQIR